MSEPIQIPDAPIIPKRKRGRPPKVKQAIIPVNKAIKTEKCEELNIKDSLTITNDGEEVKTFKQAAEVVKKDKQDKEVSLKSKQEKLTSLLRESGGKYDTNDAGEYQTRLESFSLNDLQDEAMKVGLKPNITTEARSLAISSMLDLFYENQRTLTPDNSGHNQTQLSDKKREKLLNLMRDAR